MAVLLGATGERPPGYLGIPWGTTEEAFSAALKLSRIEEDKGTPFDVVDISWCLWKAIGAKVAEAGSAKLEMLKSIKFRDGNVTDPKYAYDGLWGSAVFWNGGLAIVPKGISLESVAFAKAKLSREFGKARTTKERLLAWGFTLIYQCSVWRNQDTTAVLQFIDRSAVRTSGGPGGSEATIFLVDNRFIPVARARIDAENEARTRSERGKRDAKAKMVSDELRTF